MDIVSESRSQAISGRKYSNNRRGYKILLHQRYMPLAVLRILFTMNRHDSHRSNIVAEIGAFKKPYWRLTIYRGSRIRR